MRKYFILFALALLLICAVQPAYSTNEGTISVTDDDGNTRIVPVTSIAEIVDDGDSTCTIILLNGTKVTSNTTQAAVRTLVATAWSVSATNLTYSGTVQAEQLTSTDDVTVTDAVGCASVTASATVQAEQLTSTDDATITDDLGVGGDATVTGTVSAEQLTTTDDLTVTGAATVGETFDVTGAATAASYTATGTIQAEQLTTTDDLTVTGLATVGETLAVTGATTCTGGIVEISSPKASPTLGGGATTYAVATSWVVMTGDGGGNTLATITGAADGQILTILFVDSNITVTDTDAHSANTVDLVGTATDLTSADDTILTIIFDGTSWYEISRSVN